MGCTAIPLAERRCTKCGKGVAQGARFRRRPAVGPNSHYAICCDCDNARVREMLRIRRGWDPEVARATPPKAYPTGWQRRQDDAQLPDPPPALAARSGFRERWEGDE